MQNVMFAAVVIGILGGAAAGYFAIRGVVMHLARRAKHPSFVRASAGIAGTLLLLPAAFLAVTVGGNFGGTLGARLLPLAIGAPIGIAFGLASVFMVCIVVGSLAGALLGNAISALRGATREA